MKLWQPQTWSITARLVMVATVPSTLMFIVVNLSLYFSGQDEVRKTIQERGQLISAALAETSQYGVVSGNTSYLERNVRQLLKTDRSDTAAPAFAEACHAPQPVRIAHLGQGGAVSASRCDSMLWRDLIGHAADDGLLQPALVTHSIR